MVRPVKHSVQHSMNSTVDRSRSRSLSLVGGVVRGLVGSLVGGVAIAIAGGATIAQTPAGGPVVLAKAPVQMTLQGTSGGAKSSDCGFVDAKPSQTIQITEAFVSSSGYLSFAVTGAGDPTLVIDGPTGRFCVLGDRANGRGPQMAGYWQPGTHTVSVGDRGGQRNPYTLTIRN